MQCRTGFCAFCCHRLFLMPCIPGSRHAFGCVVLQAVRLSCQTDFGEAPGTCFGWPFCSPKKYRGKSLWFSSSLSHTLTYFFSFYLQKYYIYIIYSLYIYLLLYIVCIYIIFKYYTRARAKSTLLYKAVNYVIQHIFGRFSIFRFLCCKTYFSLKNRVQ